MRLWHRLRRLWCTLLSAAIAATTLTTSALASAALSASLSAAALSSAALAAATQPTNLRDDRRRRRHARAVWLGLLVLQRRQR